MATAIPHSAFERRVEALIADQAARTPQAVAVVFRGAQWTYAELMTRAEAIAVMLQARGAAQSDIVGLHLPRSADMLAAMIGIWRAGAAYLPLDPAFPQERLAYMAADSGARVILCTDGGPRFEAAAEWASIGIGDWGLGTGASGFATNDDPHVSKLARTPNPQSPIPNPQPQDLAYLLYTSGSTGMPKGVAVEHTSVVNFLLSMAEEPGLTAIDKFLAVTTISFDIAGLELFLPLIVGASVVIAEEDDALDGERLKALLDDGVTAMQATPTGWRVLIEAGWAGKPGFKALVGGEALPVDLAKALTARCESVWNMYGPTETTIWSACAKVPTRAESVLIGKPIANTGLYVLDRGGNPQPPGVVGEIFIGGAGVARGYWKRDDLTAERFLPDPFLDGFGGRMYRTGDLGRILKSGDLEFRGRADTQVKVRGFRVELGEIEAALAGASGVKAAAAKVFGSASEARIVAYVETDAEIDANALRESLHARLPHYMIPQHIVALNKFPLTPNGKIDRNRLPDAEAPKANGHYVEPQTETERLVAKTFSEVLNAERVSAEANFFDLGGHSILAIRALALLRRDLAPELDLASVFDAAHVRDLARRIDERRGAQVYEF